MRINIKEPDKIKKKKILKQEIEKDSLIQRINNLKPNQIDNWVNTNCNNINNIQNTIKALIKLIKLKD